MHINLGCERCSYWFKLYLSKNKYVPHIQIIKKSLVRKKNQVLLTKKDVISTFF